MKESSDQQAMGANIRTYPIETANIDNLAVILKEKIYKNPMSN
jgi:hypothetical protein